MAKRALKIFGISLGSLIVIGGIIVGILFATGVIKLPSGSNEIRPTLSNSEIIFEDRGGIKVPKGLKYNVSYNRSPSGSWSFEKVYVYTLTNGRKISEKQSSPGLVGNDEIIWSDIPANVQVYGHVRYTDKNGAEIISPVSNTLSVDVPSINNPSTN